MTWKRSTRRSFCLLVTVLLVSCATPATRSDLTPTFSGLTSSQITIGVVDSRPYVISGNKEPWFEGIVRGGFGIPYTFNRPDRPPNETFADRIAKMLERTFTDAGSQVTVVRLARGSTQPAARGKLKPQTKDVALLIRIHDSKFDAGGFQFDYPYHFQLSVLDPEGNTLAQASVQGRDAHTPSSKYNVWDMYGVVYRDKLEQLLVKPEIQLAIASPSRTVPVEKHTVSVEQAETETVGKNTDSVSEATAITSGLLAQSEQETQRREQYTKADGKAVAETLAALKLLHDQGVLSDKDYMQKQREIINEHTRKTQASLAGHEPLTTSGSGSPQEGSPSGATAVATVTALGVTSEKEVSESIPPIAVAVFPFARSGMVVTNDADHLLPEFAHQYVSENRQLRLSASYFKQEDSKIGSQADYWSATSQPLNSRIFSDGARIDADVVLMYSYLGRYTMEDSFNVTVYLFDIKNRRAHQSSGNQNNYKRVTESLFNELMAIQ